MRGVLYCRAENDLKDRPTNAAVGARSAGGGASIRISYGHIFSFPTGLSDKQTNKHARTPVLALCPNK